MPFQRGMRFQRSFCQPSACRAFARAFLGASTLAAVTGCDVDDLTGLKDSLTSPDATLVDAPGLQLLHGQYQDLVVSGSERSGAFIAARTVADEPHLHIVSYATKEWCDAGKAASTRVAVSAFDVPVVIEVSGEQRDDGSYAVRYVNIQCVEVLGTFEHVTFHERYENQLTILLEANGNLHRLDPHAGLDEVLLSNVTAIDVMDGVVRALTSSNELWLVDAVNVEAPLLELDNVRGFQVEHSWAQQWLLVEEGLSVEVYSNGELDEKLPMGCSASMPPDGGFPLLLKEQCADSWHLWTPNGTELELELELNTTTLWERALFSAQDAVHTWFFESQNRQSLGKVHWGSVGDVNEQPAPVLNEVEGSLCRNELCLTDWQPGGGRLDRFRLARIDEAPVQRVQLAERAVGLTDAYFCDVALAWVEHNGDAADLVCINSLEPEVELKAIAQGIAHDGAYHSPEALWKQLISQGGQEWYYDGEFALVTEVKDGRGKLRVLSAQQNSEPKLGPVLASDALPWRAQPLRGVSGAAYVAANDKRTLRAVLAESNLTLDIHDHVSELTSASWPVDCIVYIVDTGDDAGVWIAKEH